MSAEEHQSRPSGYEKQDTSVKAVVITTAVSVVMIALALVALWDFYVATREKVVYEQTLRPVSQQLIELQQVEDSLLSRYEFIDSTAGTYRIPIERAMELMADETAGTARR